MLAIKVTGLEPALQKLRQLGRVDQVIGYLVKDFSEELAKIASGEAHVWSGTLRANQRATIESSTRARVHADSAAVNPWTGWRLTAYDYIEEGRGGSHAFYSRSLERFGSVASSRGQTVMVREYGP